MNGERKHKQPMPKNGVKVNNWETLRPYVEEAAPPTDVYIEGLSNKGAAFGPNWNLEYNKLGKDDIPKNIDSSDLQKM